MTDFKKLMLIIKTFTLFKDVLKHWGYDPECLIVFVTSMQVKTLIKELVNFEKIIFTPYSDMEKIKQVLFEVFSEFILFITDDGVKSQILIKELGAYVRSGLIDGKEFVGLPVIISSDIIQKDVIDNVFHIFVDEVEIVDLSIETLVPTMSDLALIETNAAEVNCKDGSIKDALNAAACICYAAIKQDDACSLEELLGYVDSLVERNNQLTDPDGIPKIFIHQLFEWISNQDSILVWELDRVPEKILEKHEEVIFFSSDEKFVYISNKKFREIVMNLKTLFSVTTLKKALAEEDVLVTGTGKGYTSKMTTFNEYGQSKRFDMLKFRAEEVNYPGEADIISRLKESRNGKH